MSSQCQSSWGMRGEKGLRGPWVSAYRWPRRNDMVGVQEGR